MSNSSLYVYKNRGVAHVEFGHHAANSMSLQLLERLAVAFRELATDDTVNVVVLKSEGRTVFCSGASFQDLLDISNVEQGVRFFSGFADVILAMKDCGKIIVGRVQGKCVGGGVGLVAACDYVYATESASIKLSELSIAIGPFVIKSVVERKMGIAAFSELTLDTEWKNAYWAKEKGLYSKVYESVGDMDSNLDFFLSKFASYSSDALKAIKSALWEGTEHWKTILYERAKISSKLALSEESKVAVLKLKNKL